MHISEEALAEGKDYASSAALYGTQNRRLVRKLLSVVRFAGSSQCDRVTDNNENSNERTTHNDIKASALHF
jgi:hypothetical protein